MIDYTGVFKRIDKERESLTKHVCGVLELCDDPRVIGGILHALGDYHRAVRGITKDFI